MKDRENKKPGFWYLLAHYLHDRRAGILFYFFIISVFLIIFNLNRLDYFSELFYGVIITGFVLLLYGCFDFCRYWRECGQLLDVLHAPEEIYGRLPEKRGLQNELYHEIIREMDGRRRRILSCHDEQERERKDYYGMWVHQIKTPIQGARLLLEREEMKGLPSARGLGEEIFKIEQYVEMALQYLRCQSMGEDLILKEYELSAIVRKAVKKYALFFINGGLSLRLEEFTLPVLTDEKWLAFALEQLLSNAVKYTKKGGISIYLDTSCTVYERRPVRGCLVIEDTGIGIRQEDLPRIFEKGFTGFNGRLDRKSTGIGLYLCKEVLKKLAVPVRVESRTGEGTRVLLHFLDYDNTDED